MFQREPGSSFQLFLPPLLLPPLLFLHPLLLFPLLPSSLKVLQLLLAILSQMLHWLPSVCVAIPSHPFDIVEPVSILPPPLVPDLLDLVDLLVPAAIVAAFALAAASAPGPRPASVAHLSKDKISCRSESSNKSL